MKFDLNMTVTLDADDITKLITQELNGQGFDVKSVTVNIGKRCVGHQMNSFEEAYLKDITAKVVKKKSNSYMDR